MKLGYWIDKHFKRQTTYRLVGPTIIRGDGRRPDSRIHIPDITGWINSGSKWLPQITLYLSDGREIYMNDKHMELKAILKKHLPNATI